MKVLFQHMQIIEAAFSWLVRSCILTTLFCQTIVAGERFDRFDGFLDAVGEKLSYSSAGGTVRGRLSGALDLEYYDMFQPRATVHLDVQAGPVVYAFAQLRADRGYNPDGSGHLRGRLDEYAVRVTPWADGRLSVQAGQFATVMGQWVKRHLSWQNSFVSTPLFYAHATHLSDLESQYTAYSLVSSAEYSSAYSYNPVIWGAAYATGIAVSGRWSEFEWAAEVKNAALMSRPEYWKWGDAGLSYPTVSGRIAWRPDLRWTIGLAASQGIYLGESAMYAVPYGRSRREYEQRVWLADISYEYRHLQVWAELMHARFNVPGVGVVDSTAYFVEAKYKFTPRLYGALRWNQQFFSEVEHYGQAIGKWGQDASRLDLAATFRISAHTQFQVEVDWYTQRPSGTERSVELAARFTLRF